MKKFPSVVMNTLLDDIENQPEGTSIIMSFSRDTVMACDTSPALQQLQKLTASENAFCKFEASMYLNFDGWDNDKRELFEIPECRRFMEELGQRWPYFLNFLVPDHNTAANLYFALSCYDRYDPPQVHFNPEKYQVLLDREEKALLELCKKFTQNR